MRVAITSAIGYGMGFLRMRSCGVQSATALSTCFYALALGSRRPIQRRNRRNEGVAGVQGMTGADKSVIVADLLAQIGHRLGFRVYPKRSLSHDVPRQSQGCEPLMDRCGCRVTPLGGDQASSGVPSANAWATCRDSNIIQGAADRQAG